MQVYTTVGGGSLAEVVAQARHLEATGVTGVLATDHLFMTGGSSRQDAARPPEPLTLLAAIAASTQRLTVGTIVSNAGLLHPALLVRQFAQIAQLVGGERVLAGLGAGWNREEFDALGKRMPPHAERVKRLEEAAHLARQLFDHGFATLEGEQVIARDLPLAPLPATPPRLLVGGGSDRLLEIAGRYADVLDLNGSARSSQVRGQDLRQADRQRRLSTTVADLERSIEVVRQAARDAGRPEGAVAFTVLVGSVAACRAADVAQESAAICAAAGLSPRDLSDCPYVLVGEPAQMVDKLAGMQARLGIGGVIMAASHADWFCQEVLGRPS